MIMRTGCWVRGTNEAWNCRLSVGWIPSGTERKTKPSSLESVKDRGVVASGP